MSLVEMHLIDRLILCPFPIYDVASYIEEITENYTAHVGTKKVYWYT